ncbi:MAG: flagellar biosynthesis anti-sigma factor FlgM [Sedimentisphaerales bacterium]|nr:flagellar biosynthesis anti-sigma factor FlgM [Sedimentisphaerales bacterium]
MVNNVRNINNYTPPPPVGQTSPAGGAGKSRPLPSRAASGADKVEISPIAQFLSRIAEIPDIRAEKVEQIRQELANGDYDVEGKLPEALERFLEENLPQ